MIPGAGASTPAEPVEETTMLDEVIERIDQTLPVLHQQVSNGRKPPTSKRAKRIFKEMCEDPLLTDDGADIRLAPKKNGTRPT